MNDVTHKTKVILDYIHTNMWGATRVTSKGDSRYFVAFINDFSQRVLLYIIKQKNKVIGIFKKWKTMIDK